MKLKRVENAADAREFLMLPVRLYKEVPQWIRPLDKDIELIFDPQKNKTFRNGICTRWILKDDHNKTIGRIAAFVNHKTANKNNEQPTGGIGFFECINDQNAAFTLFDAGKAWLKEQGMEAMDGPVNFGDRDKWWGLLVDGFDKEPNYTCNYNFPYYQQFFEDYGFQIYFKQYTYARKTDEPLSAKLKVKADRIAANPDYTFRHIELKNLNQYTEHFREIYNKAWGNHKGVATLSSLVAKQLMKQMKPIIDEKIMWFGYYKNEPVAMFINLPEVNQIFKHVNGKLDLVGKLKFLYHKWRKTSNKMFGVVFGVVPEHQGKGIDGAIIEAMRVMVQERYTRYENYEMNWIGDFNPKMINVVQQVGATVAKTHITYRKLFDESKPFKRHPIIN